MIFQFALNYVDVKCHFVVYTQICSENINISGIIEDGAKINYHYNAFSVNHKTVNTKNF